MFFRLATSLNTCLLILACYLFIYSFWDVRADRFRMHTGTGGTSPLMDELLEPRSHYLSYRSELISIVPCTHADDYVIA